MRKAILNEKGKVIGFTPIQEELSEQAKERRAKTVDHVMRKYGFKK